MPTYDQRLKQVTLKLDRAREHAANVDAELAAFYATNPYRVDTKPDPANGGTIYFVGKLDQVPDRLLLIAGDSIQCLIATLDHLAYQIICVDTRDPPENPSMIYFPIGKDLADFEDKKRRRFSGASGTALAALDALKPYGGGNDLFLKLHRVNNIDKHRVLLTAFTSRPSINIGQFMAQKMLPDVSDTSPMAKALREALPRLNSFYREKPMGPISIGHEIFKVGPGANPAPNQQFRFHVTLHEPGIIEEAPLVELLAEFCKLGQSTVDALSPFLKKSTP